MSSLFFWFVYFTLNDILKNKGVFFVVLSRTTGQYTLLGNLHCQFNVATKITFIYLKKYLH